MTKIKLTETFQTPKDLPLDINGFDVPKIMKVDFTTARVGYAYNANRERTDHIEKYTIQGVDEKVYLALQTAGINIADVKTIQIEFTNIRQQLRDKRIERMYFPNEKRKTFASPLAILNGKKQGIYPFWTTCALSFQWVFCYRH